MIAQRHLIIAGVVTTALIVGIVAFNTQPGNRDPLAAQLAFRDAVQPAPPNWSGRVFELSHDYPADQPGTCAPEVCTWLHMPMTFANSPTAPVPEWNDAYRSYIGAILDYIMQGQDPNLGHDAGFSAQVDGSTRWYHVPWMAYDETAGREFVHGTTNERTAHLGDLIGDGVGFGTHDFANMSSACTAQFAHGFETWAVGVYNEWGGWSIGQAFPRNGRPSIGEYLGRRMPNGLPFPEGTVVAKFLTTNATPECVPFLRGAPEWQVHRHAMADSGKYSCERAVQTSRLVQVDIAVVDPRSPTRWVYGTFAYNGNAPGATARERLLPVGLQWGSDPWSFPAVPQAEAVAPRQSVLDPDIGIFQHYGCNNRLAGPVDNAMSSCVSCHASAFATAGGGPSMMGRNAPPSFGFPGLCTQYSLDNAQYFDNYATPQAYPGGTYAADLSLDTSLQLAVAFTEYGYFNTAAAPKRCTNPNQF